MLIELRLNCIKKFTELKMIFNFGLINSQTKLKRIFFEPKSISVINSLVRFFDIKLNKAQKQKRRGG